MTIAWDKSDELVWYGIWTGEPVTFRLHLVAEHLPESERWAWAVWQSDEPRILRRGVATGAAEATTAAELAAIGWRRIGAGDRRVPPRASGVWPSRAG
jgi:hypothetical protein